MEPITVGIPEGVRVSLGRGKNLAVTGPLGTIEADFSHARDIWIRLDGDVITVGADGQERRRKVAMIGTITAHIRNMLTGVTRGFTYRMKIVYAHFPMSVKVQTDRIIVENFGGERRPRSIRIGGGVKVSVEGDDVVVRGTDVRGVGQTSANIEQMTRVRSKDPRVFLDGIFVYEKREGM